LRALGQHYAGLGHRSKAHRRVLARTIDSKFDRYLAALRNSSRDGAPTTWID
jgi:hypothetical protein